MHVLATAGHVDHGKSSLVRALTGMEPDRFAEERRRGLTIDLGFAWTTIGGEQVALVDVPGHERFVPTMLAGVGPVPAVVLVVAADSGWMPQSQEHLDALDALGVAAGLLVVTRSDLADADLAVAEAREHLAGTSLEAVEAVTVSSVTGEGLDAVRAAIGRLVAGLPSPDRAAPVRLWADRVFTLRGAGTVVTGTLAAGTLRAGDRLHLPGGREVGVRGLHSLGAAQAEVPAVARVAVNLRGVAVTDVARGDALVTPGTHLETSVVDVRLRAPGGRPLDDLPQAALVHVGAAQVEARLRPLGGDVVRLTLRTRLPLRGGDTGLLRDPGRRLVLAGFTALDVDPPPLRRRGAATARARDLAPLTGRPDAAAELARRRVAHRDHLVATGVAPGQVEGLVGAAGAVHAGGWIVDPAHAVRLRSALADLVAEHARTHPLEPGPPADAVRRRLDLPAAALVQALVVPPLALVEGRVVDRGRDATGALPGPVAQAVAQVRDDLAAAPWSAPDANRLRDLGLGPRELAAAARAGALHRLADGVYLTPEGVSGAAEPLRTLAQPFTVSDARQAWGTSRRVALPLLAYLDGAGVTRPHGDGTRSVVAPGPAGLL